MTSNDSQESLYDQPLSIRVGNCIKERRIDKYLHGRFSNFSRRFLQDTIKGGHVQVNGQSVKPSYQLTAGEMIDLVLPAPQKKEILPEDIPLEVVYEDDDLILINKQANIIVHPARGNRHGTLVNALTHYSDTLSSGLGEFRPGIVHRLDRNTTGIMIVARNDEAQWKVAKQFENREVKKEYLAIVHGTPQLTADRINARLGIHPRIREKYAVRPERGKDSVTFYEILEAFSGYSLLKCAPRTGRTHQIRVHLSHIKHPIVADDMYGGKLVYPWQLENAEAQAQDPCLARCALHAWTIEFRHPTTEEMVKFEAPMPDDMKHLLEMLRTHRSGPKEAKKS
ncbi:MAG: RluA family pseudouridine synthase [Phycisphaeraceae bacterium]|nr:RluA family pseudouridine synthase [Phycisphaeraceae bacterium]